MSLKTLTIGKKITLGYAVILILLIIVGVLNYVGVGTIVNNAEEVIDGNKLTSMLVQREIDHLRWAGKVNALLTDDSVTELVVQTDDHKCGMGKWLYGPERKQAEKLLPSLVPILKSLEEPHRKLHESAIDIDLSYEQGDLSLPIRITEIESAHLAWANRAYKAVINKNTKIKKFQTDPTKCMLGKFINSDQGLAAYEHGDADFKELWDSIHPSHNAMHAAGKNIKNLLAEEQFESASVELQKVIMPNLSKTVSTLKELRSEAEEKLHGMAEANDIYANQTMPALGNVQEILAKAKDTVKKNIMTDEIMLSAATATRMQVAIVGAITFLLGIILAALTARGIISLLSGVVKEMSASSNQVSGAAGQISESSQSLAEGASEQAATLEETSSSLEEMSSLTRQNAENAKQADMIRGESRESMETADNSMKELIESMADISSASEKTQKIVKTIDEIAFQTNLLALNAAVEAARAGEAGAGFAVVADEVRSLAMRAADSARDTTSLLDATVEKVKNGTALVSETSEMFYIAARSSERVSTLITEISTASQEQSTGIDEVNRAVTEIDKVTQANAAVAEETASAAEELTAQAAGMNDIVHDLEKMVGIRNQSQTASPSQAKQFNEDTQQDSAKKMPPKQLPPASSPKPKASKATKAEDVIPFDDDDFQDF
jgi:methyl-accepting chemotaxis protein